MSHQQTTLVIFCKVVDNYGDIGICWRLARQLAQEHAITVTLWVDDLHSFRRICPEVDPGCDTQQVQGVLVRHWRGQEGSFAPEDVADVVIEFFGVDIPPAYIEAMARREPRPAWINYEGLTAQEWVEDCHLLPSMHPRLPITKHFFFPGYTPRTGGLLHETGLEEARHAFQSDPEKVAAFLARFGVSADEMPALKVSLFCYPQAPVAQLLRAWEEGGDAVTCLVPEGVARDTVQAFLGQEATPGASATRGALTVRVLPFVPQPDYDRLLWSCDVNFVRGEDSWVRAQFAGRPFIWNIYPQDENLHHVKLRAFLQRYAAGIDSVARFSLGWNGALDDATDWAEAWRALREDIPAIRRRNEDWQRQVLENGDLVGNLLAFVSRGR